MAIFPKIELSTCAFCETAAPLCDSHIIPRFVYRWKIETSPTGRFRSGIAPNVRLQDGQKANLLCAVCEERFSNWETQTANSLFYPYHADASMRVQYGPWLAKFVASVVWRVLLSFKHTGELKHLTAQQLELAEQALGRWRDFMADRVSDPGAFELHLLPVTLIANVQGGDLPSNMNRYLSRVIDTDVGSNSNSAFVYAKMGRLIVFGFVQMPHPEWWGGTRVDVLEGTIQPREYQLHKTIGQYLESRALRTAELQRALSPRQKQRIDDAFRSDPDRVAFSDMFQALRRDVEMFGEDRVFNRLKEKSDR
ncbi:MAG: hypothetical protein AB1451_06405 [Nitrospirota bacterium]